MICFDFPCQPVPWLSEVPEDKDMSMGMCFGNAKPRSCSGVAYSFISERGGAELAERKQQQGRKAQFSHITYTDQPQRIRITIIYAPESMWC